MSSNPNLDPVQAMLAQTSLQNTLFAANSRYYKIPTKVVEIAPGKTVAYLQRRFLPPSASFQTLQQYTVTLGLRTFVDSSAESDWGGLFAMSSLSLVPIFLIFLFFQRLLIEGIATSGMKR